MARDPQGGSFNFPVVDEQTKIQAMRTKAPTSKPATTVNTNTLEGILAASNAAPAAARSKPTNSGPTLRNDIPTATRPDSNAAAQELTNGKQCPVVGDCAVPVATARTKTSEFASTGKSQFRGENGLGV